MFSSLPGPPAGDHGVDRPQALDLDHRLALAAQVGRVDLLRDHALAASRATARPRPGRRPAASARPCRASAEALDELLERRAALGERVRRAPARRRPRAGRRRGTAPASARRASAPATRPGGGGSGARRRPRARRRRGSAARRRSRSGPRGTRARGSSARAAGRFATAGRARRRRRRRAPGSRRTWARTPSPRRSGSVLRESASWGSIGGLRGSGHADRSLASRAGARAASRVRPRRRRRRDRRARGRARAGAAPRRARGSPCSSASRAIAAHQTSHSSGVIHSGIYYEPGSLKARLCVAGARELYEYCDERGIDARRDGKLIVATDEAELGRLDELERRGTANGVAGPAPRRRRRRSARSSRTPPGSRRCTRRRPASSTSRGSRPPTRTTCARPAAR